MQSITVKELVAAVRGTLVHGSESAVIRAVSTDSRTVREGELFIPVKGERFDGHDYIESALQNGAAGCLFRAEKEPEKKVADKIYIAVDDPLLALKRLGIHYRDRADIPFIQITGSVGKTTTKEMVAGMLAGQFCTIKTEGNFNSDLGVPKTMLELTGEHEVAVIETGMDHFGEIRYLGEIVKPQIAVITNVGDVHAEFLGGTREGVFRAKCEIFENLAPDGVAILNGDDALLNTVTLPQRIVRCGRSEHCDVRIRSVETHGLSGIACRIETARSSYALRIAVPGEHVAYSAAIAVAVAEELGMRHDAIVAGIEDFRSPDKRMEVVHLAHGRVMINDSYNANPQSMAAALRVLAQADTARHIAFLGDMKELGGTTEAGHREIARLIAALQLDEVLCIGPFCKAYLADELEKAGGTKVTWYPGREEAYPDLVKAFAENTALLINGSHFANRLDLAADYLREYPFEGKR